MSDNELQVSNEPSGQLHETPMCIELGETFGLAPQQVIKVLRSIIKVPKGEPPATPAELIIALSVMQQYRMNPMMKQIHVWRDHRGDLAVMAGYDFWTQKANEQPGFKNVSYEYGPELPSKDSKARTCWEWVRATVHDSIRGDMVMFPVYLEEWYQAQRGNYAGPWQDKTRHKLHIVAYRLAIREAYSIAIDIRDPEDFARADVPTMAEKTADNLSDMGPLGGTPHSPPSDPVYEEAEVVDGGSMDGQTPPDVPCGASGCGGNADVQCLSCGAMFCRKHTDNEVCGVCQLGDGEE